MKDVLVKVFSNGQVFLPNNILVYEDKHTREMYMEEEE